MRHIDKLHHAVYSFALAVAGAFLFGLSVGLILAAGLGLAKELHDAGRGRFDVCDLAANAAGLLAAWVVIACS